MNKLIRFFLDNSKFTVILTLLLIAFGLMGLKGINSESYPSVNFAIATIDTRYDGATAEDVETKITKPIEDEIRKVSGLKDVRSISKTGFSSIFVRVDMDNEDEDEVLNDLQKAVEGVSDLPADLRDDPEYKEVNSEEFPAIEIAIVGSNNKRLRDEVADLLKEELEDNKKIKSIRLSGFTKRQFNIRLDETKLVAQHIGLEEVLLKIRERNVNIPGGDISNNGEQRLIRVEGEVASVSDLEQLVVRSNFTGNKVLLKDLAIVTDSHADEDTIALYNGQPSTFAIVNKKAGADTIELVKDVNVVLAKFEEKYKDKLKFNIYNNEANKVKDKLDILSSNAVSGLILVIVFLLLFLPGKIGVAASFSLPIAIIVTFGFFPIFEMNLDAITILALVISLGMLVDNSVVISENFARIRKDEPFLDVTDAIVKSVGQLWLPITATGLTTISAFLPMLVTKGIMGQFIRFIPIVVSISLVISLLESFFFLPMRLRIADGGKRNAQKINDKDWFDGAITKFEKFMRWSVKSRYKVMSIFIAVIVGSLLLMALGNKFMLFPAEQTEVYVGRLEMPRGTTIEETRDELKRITKSIQLNTGDWQKWVTSRAGTSSMGPTDVKGATGDNYGLILIYASDYAKYNINYKDFLIKLKKTTSDLAQGLEFRELVNGPPVGEPISVTFRSNNLESLNKSINEVKDYMSGLDGVSDLKIDDVLGEKEIKIKTNYELADQLGISVQRIGNALRTALSGTMVSTVTLKNKDVDLNVRYLDNYRESDENIKKVKVMDSRGNLIPVGEVAKIEITKGQYEIKRFDFKRAKLLTGNVDGISITSITANKLLWKKFESISKNYNDVNLVYGGEQENTKESMESLGQALILALMGIFALLVFLFGSYLRPLIIMTTIPLGLIGFSIAFFFHNKEISFMAMIGVIGLAGIIVNSGIVLISFIDQLKEEGKLPMDEILVKASGMRLRAVLVTSLTTISGLIPTAYGIGGSDSMLVPMTLAMAWGLTSGTVLTLVWVPCAYAILGDISDKLATTRLKFLVVEKYKTKSKFESA